MFFFSKLIFQVFYFAFVFLRRPLILTNRKLSSLCCFFVFFRIDLGGPDKDPCIAPGDTSDLEVVVHGGLDPDVEVHEDSVLLGLGGGYAGCGLGHVYLMAELLELAVSADRGGSVVVLQLAVV